MANRKMAGVADVTINPDGSQTLWNGTTVWYSLEHEGVTYSKGDAITIAGISGNTKFWSAQRPPNGQISVTVWWEGHHFRDAVVERIVSRHQLRVSNVGLLEAKRQLVRDYAEEHAGTVVSLRTLSEVSGLSLPTVSKFVKENNATFRPVKRGHYEIIKAQG